MPLLLAPVLLAACSDSNLYHRFRPPAEPDRLAVSGEVCTDDPASARFPVRVVLVVDQAPGPLYATYDPGAIRLQVLSAFVQSALANPEYALAVVGFGGTAEKLAPLDGNFTRNPGELLNAVTRLSLPRSCAGVDTCRSYREGLRTARALIEGDLSALPAGQRVLTQYVVILVDAGLHAPLTAASECCQPGDVACIQSGDAPSAACQAQKEVEDVAAMREAVAAAGASGLRLHVLHLAAESLPADNDLVGEGLERMAFTGGGLYQRFNSPNTFTLTDLDVLDLRTILRAKHLVVANVSALPTPDGPVPDSDGDGLPDAEETTSGLSDPTLRDTDGDGITDLVEILVGFDPRTIDTPAACDGLTVGRDLDLDGLTDCDEALVGTDRSLVDTDGDGAPDRLELYLGTDYLHPDAVRDMDGDGVSNGDEIAAHTDPRSSDGARHLSQGYRTTLTDEGIVTQPVASRLRQLTGVEIATISPGTTPGLGTLRFFGGDAPTLVWQDAGDGQPGPAVAVGAGGEVRLPSSSYAPVQGDAGRFITVRVDPAALPPRDVTESLRVVFRARHCLRYTVRNVRLMETLPVEGALEGGWNDIFLYFEEAPEDRIETPGPVRMAHLPVHYLPPEERDPPDAIVPVADDEFVRPRISLEAGP